MTLELNLGNFEIVNSKISIYSEKSCSVIIRLHDGDMEVSKLINTF